MRTPPMPIAVYSEAALGTPYFGIGTFLSVSDNSTRKVVLNGSGLRYARQAVNVGTEAAKEVRVQYFPGQGPLGMEQQKINARSSSGGSIIASGRS